MKAEIHPQYKKVTFKCACGGEFLAGSTIGKDEFQTEICSNCHPFYTGKQKLLDTSGRVDKFVAKQKKAQETAAKKVKKVAKGKEEDVAQETAENETEA
jgi:large subunit ribosomal protein L31